MLKQASLMQDFSEPLICHCALMLSSYGVSQTYLIKELFTQGISLRNGVAQNSVSQNVIGRPMLLCTLLLSCNNYRKLRISIQQFLWRVDTADTFQSVIIVFIVIHFLLYYQNCPGQMEIRNQQLVFVAFKKLSQNTLYKTWYIVTSQNWL